MSNQRMSIRELSLIKLYLFILVTKFSVVSCMEADDYNQLVALDDDDLNNINEVNNDFERIDPKMICQVPKYAPYLTVLRTTRYEIEFNVTDINPPGYQVEGYTIYYWGFRLGPKSYRSEDRHFGHRNFTKDGPFVIENLKSKFSYCADLTSVNQCGRPIFANLALIIKKKNTIIDQLLDGEWRMARN